MEGCFSESHVLQLLDGRLTPTELQAAEAHLDACADCRALVAATAAIMPAAGARTPTAGDDGAVAPGTLPPRVGRYLVRALVGTGGMSTVYAAFDPQLGRRVALKLLKPDLGRSAGSRARLVREAQAMARLQHANVVTVHDLGIVGDRLYIAMELVDGATLAQWLRAGSRGWREIARTFVAAGRGLAAAHGAGIVHRDFKPENVLVARDGSVRVTDFGVARVTALAAGEPEAPPPLGDDIAALDTSLTVSGALLGTPVYMAPEQLMGETVDARADIFSFCAALYEALYRQRPFAFRNMGELRAAVCRGQVRPPPAGHGVPDALWRVVERGLAVRPDARWPSMAELIAALEAPLVDRPPPRPRRTVLFAGAALAATTLVALATIFVARGRHGADWARKPWQRRALAALVTGDGHDAALARVLDERLRAELALGSELRVVPAEAVARIQPELAGHGLASLSRKQRALVRDRLGAQLVLAGRARTLPDGRAQLTVDLRDADDGRPLAWVEDAAMPDALGTLTAEVAARLRTQLALQPPSADDEARVRAAIPSTAAVAEGYAEGLEKLRRFDADGARRTLEGVLAADPQRPLAWAALAEAWHQLQYQQRQREAARQAFERADTLPREQRLWVEAQYREAMKEWPQAVELYRSLATFFPDNLDYGLRLADAQVAAGNPTDAAATLARLQQLPPPDGNDPRIDLSRALARSRSGDGKSALPILADARRRAQASGNRQLLARIRVAECDAFESSVSTDQALAACRDAEQLFAAAGDRAGVARAMLDTAGLYVRAERYAEAAAHIERALDAYRAVGSEAGVGLAMITLGIDYKRVGKLPEAEKMIRGAVAQLKELNEPYYYAYAEHILAATLTDLDRLDEAAPHYEKSIEIARGIHLDTLTAEALSNYSNLLLREARVDDALANAEQSVALYRALKMPPDAAYALDTLGQAQLELDRLADAQHTFEEALKMREAVGWAGGASRQNLAEVAIAERKYDRAVTLAQRAVDELHEKHMGLAEAYARTVLTEALFEEGRAAQAADSADKAVALAKAAGSDLAEAGIVTTVARAKASKGDVAGALSDVRAEIARTQAKKLVRISLWSRWSLAEIQAEHDVPAARQTLRELVPAANERHLRQLARQATTLQHHLRDH